MPATQLEVLDLGKCPHCSVSRPLLERKLQTSYKGELDRHTRDWAIYFCRSCGGPVTTGAPHGSGGQIDTIFPAPVTIPDSVPGRPRTYLQQALDALHAPAASIMVAASAVDAMLKERGLVEGTLHLRINQAADAHLITNEMAAWAHDVRLDANDERHADLDASAASPEDAKRCFDFALGLAQYLFVLPAMVARGRAALTAGRTPRAG